MDAPTRSYYLSGPLKGKVKSFSHKASPNKKWSVKAKYKEIPKYRISLPVSRRHRILIEEINRRPGTLRDKAISVRRSLQMIVNLNASYTSDMVMMRDIKWITRRYKL